jgi:phage tail-like protein
MPAHSEDPYANFSFVVEIDGIADGSSIHSAFSEVSGLGVEIIPIEYRSGADNRIRKIPGLRKFSNVTLKRGITGDTALWAWLKATTDGEPTAANVTIRLLDQRRDPVMSWRLWSAWPCRWTGPTLNGSGNEIAVESLELCHEGITLE